MTSQLEKIILQKHREVDALKCLVAEQPQHIIGQILRGTHHSLSKKSFKKALRYSSLAIIAEIKRKSPSKGMLAPINDPAALAKNYVASGANAISVLTDEMFFSGKLADLTTVSSTLRKEVHPVLRKDFIIDEIQIAEAAMAGADAILIIVAAVYEQTKTLLNCAKNFGLEALIEVHNQQELELALNSGAEIIGINNRDLHSLQVDTEQALKLIENIPPEIVRVAESGILAPELARDYYRAGFDAVLIGEALVKSGQPEKFMQACRHV